jgi:hypothetical protein
MRVGALSAATSYAMAHHEQVPGASEFEVTLFFRLVNGPFRGRLTVADDYIEVAPTAPWPLSKLRAFRTTRVTAPDVAVVEGDAPSRRGLRVRTASGLLDRFVLVPTCRHQRADLHAAMVAHGYVLA